MDKNAKRYSKRKGLAIIELSLLVALFCSCTPSAQSEGEVVKDLQNDSRFFPMAEIQIIDYTISKRQTAKENRSDTVWITVTANNEDITCSLSYIMTYHLYNSGWILDEVEQDYDGEWIVTPLRGVDDSIIQGNIDSYTDSLFDSMEIVNRTTDLENGMDTISYSATKDHLYGSETMFVDQIFYFDSSSCTYYPAADLYIYDRSLVLKDTIVGATWNCTRYYDRFDAWPDKFQIEATEFYEDEWERAWVTFTINRERNTYWGGNEPIYWGVNTSFVVSDHMEYLETEYKWGFNVQSINEYLYSEGDSEQFTENDWFCFDLDQSSTGYFVEYTPIVA